MRRRLLGPIGSCCLFLAVSLLVAGGLAWVTYAALGVERDQRVAAALADRADKERYALWRLDGRVYPALGLESYRQFEQFTALYSPPGDPPGAPIFVSPLTSATLPDWMKLHFQIDPAIGWTSPQVIPEHLVLQLTTPPNAIDLSNVTPERRKLLDELNERYPAVEAIAALRENESIPEDSSPSVVVISVNPSKKGSETGRFSVNPEGVALAPGSSKGSDTKPNIPIPAVPDNLTGNELANRGQSGGRASDPPGYLGNTNQIVNPPSQKGDPDNFQAQGRRGSFDKALRDARGGINSSSQAIPQQGEAYFNRNDLRTILTLHGNDWQAASLTPLAAATGWPMSIDLTGQEKQNLFLQNAQIPLPGAGSPGRMPPTRSARGAPGGTGGFGSPPPNAQDQGVAPVAPKMATTGDLNKQEKGKLDPENKRPDAAASPPPNRELKSQSPPVVETSRQPPPGQAGGIQAAPAQQAATPKPAPSAPPPAVHLGVMRPRWLTDSEGNELLIVVRSARLEGKTVYQGILLDWDRVQAVLNEEIAEEFPQAKLLPSHTGDMQERQLTALPVRLDPGPMPELPAAGWTPLRTGLVLTWIAAAVALLAVWFGGWSLVELSERRIRFVSAVTHELRTPLTSLRLYLDMLTSGMIAEEAKKQEYLTTLSHESNRLNQLIENVLDFARLENRGVTVIPVPVPVEHLIEHVRTTWTDRLAADQKELIIVATVPPGQIVKTDARVAEQILGNLIDNARKYSPGAADRRIWLWVKPAGNRVAFDVEDRGPGVSAAERRSIFKPFHRGSSSGATGGAGLGLALARQWAESLGGSISYRPADGGTGAVFRLELPAA